MSDCNQFRAIDEGSKKFFAALRAAMLTAFGRSAPPFGRVMRRQSRLVRLGSLWAPRLTLSFWKV